MQEQNSRTDWEQTVINRLLEYLTFKKQEPSAANVLEEVQLSLVDARLRPFEEEKALNPSQSDDDALFYHPIAHRSLLFFPPLRALRIISPHTLESFTVSNPYGITLRDFECAVQKRYEPSTSWYKQYTEFKMILSRLSDSITAETLGLIFDKMDLKDEDLLRIMKSVDPTLRLADLLINCSTLRGLLTFL